MTKSAPLANISVFKPASMGAVFLFPTGVTVTGVAAASISEILVGRGGGGCGVDNVCGCTTAAAAADGVNCGPLSLNS